MDTLTQSRSIISTDEIFHVNKAWKTIRALRNRLRMKILETIEEYGNDMIVTEIYVRLGIEQSVASQHLAILRNEGIVTTRRDGKKIHYSVDHNKIEEVMQLCKSL